MLDLVFDSSVSLSKISINDNQTHTAAEIHQRVNNHLEHLFGSKAFDFYLVHNGKLLNSAVADGEIHVVPKLCGGKGGFGSMLRAIGAQIEKTTNREACRDLSGRRLRDINEEKRLKKWIAEQAEREQEALERKRKKLEKLQEVVKHDFTDEEYTKARLEMPEKIHEAVEQGLQTAIEEPSTSKEVTEKAKVPDKKKKKRKLWVDDLLDDSEASDLDDDDEEEESPKKKIKVS